MEEEVKGKQENEVGIQYAPCDCRTYPIQHRSNITSWCAHTSAASSQLNWHPHQVSHGLAGLLDSPGCVRCKHTSERGSHVSVTERHWRYKSRCLGQYLWKAGNFADISISKTLRFLNAQEMGCTKDQQQLKCKGHCRVCPTYSTRTYPFNWQMKSGFCTWAISFYLQYTNIQTVWHIFKAQDRQVVAIFSWRRPASDSGVIDDGRAVDKVTLDSVSPSTLAVPSHCNSASAMYSYTHSYTIDDT